MKTVNGFVGVAVARVLGGPAQILFGRATIGEKDVYEPLTINGLTPFTLAERAARMMTHLRSRQGEGVQDAYLAELELHIAETEKELSRRIFVRSDKPMIVLRRHRGSETDLDFIGFYQDGVPNFPEIPGSNLQFNGLKGFDCYEDALETSKHATRIIGVFCPIATFLLTKVPG